MVPQQVSELQIFALQDGNVSEEAKKHYSQVSTLENTSHRLFYNLKKKTKNKNLYTNHSIAFGPGNLLRDYVSYKRQGSFTHGTSTVWLSKQDMNKDNIQETR